MNRFCFVPAVSLALSLSALSSPAQTNTPQVQFGEKFSLHSKILNEDRPYTVYLPTSYKPDPNHTPKKYPVLYMSDGDWNFDWACEVAQFMGDTLEIPELIVVAVPNADRDKDLTPTHTTNSVVTGGGPLFERFLNEELAHEIDSKYRTEPYRIFFGHSIGGALAVDFFLRQTNGFQAFIAIDPSVWWDNRVLVQRAKEFSPDPNSRAALFIAEANWPHNLYDATNANKYSSDLFLAALKTNSSSVRVGSKFLDQEDHASSRLMGLYDGLRFVFQDYRPTNFYALNTPQLMGDHFKELSDRLGFQMLPSEAFVNKVASSLLDPPHAAQAVELLKLNVTNYPASASVYRHLADAYLAKGDKDLAIQNYKKALELNPNEEGSKKALKKLRP